MNSTAAAAKTVECPTCHAASGARCVTVLYVRQDDGTYAEVNRPTTPHTARRKLAGQ